MFLKEPNVPKDPGVLSGSRCLWRTQVSLVDSCVPAGPHLPCCILVSLMDPRVLGESKCPRGTLMSLVNPHFLGGSKGPLGTLVSLEDFGVPDGRTSSFLEYRKSLVILTLNLTLTSYLS